MADTSNPGSNSLILCALHNQIQRSRLRQVHELRTDGRAAHQGAAHRLGFGCGQLRAGLRVRRRRPSHRALADWARTLRLRRQRQPHARGGRQPEHGAAHGVGRGEPPDGPVGQRQDQPLHLQRSGRAHRQEPRLP